MDSFVVTGITPRPTIIISRRSMNASLDIKAHVNQQGILNFSKDSELAGHDLATVLTEVRQAGVEITGVDLSDRILIPSSMQLLARAMPNLETIILRKAQLHKHQPITEFFSGFTRLREVDFTGAQHAGKKPIPQNIIGSLQDEHRSLVVTIGPMTFERRGAESFPQSS